MMPLLRVSLSEVCCSAEPQQEVFCLRALQHQCIEDKTSSDVRIWIIVCSGVGRRTENICPAVVVVDSALRV